MTRVLFVLDSLGAGGAEKSTADLLPWLQRLGVEVRVAVLRHATVGFEDTVRSSGVAIHLLDSSSPFGTIRQLRRLVKEWQPDVVHTAIYWADQIGRVASVRTNAKVISSWISVPRTPVHQAEGEPPRWKLALVNLLDRVTGRLFVDRFHAVTEGVASAYATAYRVQPSQVAVVERGREAVELGSAAEQRARRARCSLGLSDKDRLVLAVGRHEHAKALPDLVQAMKVLYDGGLAVTLGIAGRSGNASLALATAIEQSCLPPTAVRVLGHREDIADLLGAANVLAIASVIEGAAGAALEAMALGTPIVSTELEGMAGILEHERNSLIVPQRDPEAMAAAIRRLLDDRELSDRLTTAARSDFLERFTLERSAERMLDLYRSVLDGR